MAGKHGLTLAQRFLKIIPEIQRMVAARTSHLDMTANNFIKRHPQGNIVNIGAGYDARFWRLKGTEAIRIYELDLPVMLSERKKIFKYDKKTNVYCVPIDLRTTTVAEALAKEPTFNAVTPTLYIWEGGSMYFDRQSSASIYLALANLTTECADSLIWFDYVTKDAVDGRTGNDEINRFIASMRKLGEPFINGINDIASLARKYRWHIIDDISSAAYLGNDDMVDKQYRFCTLKA